MGGRGNRQVKAEKREEIHKSVKKQLFCYPIKREKSKMSAIFS